MRLCIVDSLCELELEYMELKLVLFPVSKPRHINSIFTVNAPILYIYIVIYFTEPEREYMEYAFVHYCFCF